MLASRTKWRWRLDRLSKLNFLAEPYYCLDMEKACDWWLNGKKIDMSNVGGIWADVRWHYVSEQWSRRQAGTWGVMLAVRRCRSSGRPVLRSKWPALRIGIWSIDIMRPILLALWRASLPLDLRTFLDRLADGQRLASGDMAAHASRTHV